jgi:membrane protein DedA with SNARE-associated domain
MKALSIVGSVLIALGVISLTYFASPIRIMLQAILGQQKLHLLIPTTGVAAILIGVAILFATRSKATKDKK